MEDGRGFAKQEEAAIASFPPAAESRVVRTEKIDDTRVDVIVDSNPSHLVRIHCQRIGDLWYEYGEIVE